jgi:hypothetical protein
MRNGKVIRLDRTTPPVSEPRRACSTEQHEIPWSEIRHGVWEARCVCGVQYHYEGPVDSRVRQDPYDPATMHHFGQCERRNETDPEILRGILRVKDGAGGTYWYVECTVCEAEWQVPYYVEAS